VIARERSISFPRLYRAVCFTLLFSVAMAFSLPALAQRIVADAEMVLRGKLIKPAVGQWATYSLHDTATGKDCMLRMSIVGSEQIGPMTAWWVETDTWPTRGKGQRSIKRLLVIDDSSNVSNIKKMVFKIGYAPAYEAPLGPMQAAAKADPDVRTVATVGEEDVTAAGTQFKARKVALVINERQSELWMSPELHLTGVVKAACPSGTVTLVQYASEGARSAIRQMPGEQPDNIMKKGFATQEELEAFRKAQER
jgi:hypothetical protein